MTHDYERHGTTTLFAALNVVTGKVVGKTHRRHRHQEVLRFLREVEKTVPKDQEIHIVLDNYATHKHEKVLEWIERNKRVFLHFTPTSASWVNLVERFFAALTDKRILRGVFTSVPHLEKCLREYLDSYNKDPRPFVWTKTSRTSSPRSAMHGQHWPTPHNHHSVKNTTLGSLAQPSVRCSRPVQEATA